MRMMVIGIMGVLGTFRALIIFYLSSNATLRNILRNTGKKFPRLRLVSKTFSTQRGDD